MCSAPVSTVIEATKISKKYRLGQRGWYRPGLRETLHERIKELFGRPSESPHARPAQTGAEVSALREVSFSIEKGEAVGIIGRNGAGKSTLFKVLSRITEPTEGRAVIRGRLASLLEVGTGFQPDLTGRENTFLNGAILGMKRAEIQRKLDEIIAFAEVEKFVDTPVKHYSSGMYLRLAFAVAAHLEPEVLIVDEVLAVGDAAFQEKCLRKMKELPGGGRTVLFVSHNMGAVRQLCTRGILLDQGRVVVDGPMEEVIGRYVASSRSATTREETRRRVAEVPSDPVFGLREFFVEQEGRETTTVTNGLPTEVVVRYELAEAVHGFFLRIDLRDLEGVQLVESLTDSDGSCIPRAERGSYEARLVLPANFLAPVPYEIVLRAGLFQERDFIRSPLTLTISVEPGGVVNRAYPNHRTSGRILPLLEFPTRRV